MFVNYDFKFETRGKIIYVPNDRCVRKGDRIIERISKTFNFPDFFYHYAPGGHVSALQEHKKHALFFRIDIQNFFYSIKRTQVTRALRKCGVLGASVHSMWSTVKSPYGGGAFVLPIGFVQSPIIASVVLMRSPVLQAIERARTKGVTISVYLDDFVGSHDDEAVLRTAYEDIRRTCAGCGLVLNADKLVEPSAAIVAFNCDLTHGSTKVTDARVAKFYDAAHSEAAAEAFELYRNRVLNGDAAAAD
jgi:hypothetical protein